MRDVVSIQDAPDVLAVLLSVGHDLARLLPLCLKLFLGLADLLMLLGHPLFELKVLALEGARRNFILVEELIDAFLL